MNELRIRIRAAWQQATRELGIRFTSPYEVTLNNGQRVTSLGLVHSFGRPRGTLILVHGDEQPFRPGDLGNEYFCSELTDSYATYDRKLFTETLDDWGWCGPKEEAPNWYTGKAWA